MNQMELGALGRGVAWLVGEGGGRSRDARERTDAEAVTDGSPRSHRLLRPKKWRPSPPFSSNRESALYL